MLSVHPCGVCDDTEKQIVLSFWKCCIVQIWHVFVCCKTLVLWKKMSWTDSSLANNDCKAFAVAKDLASSHGPLFDHQCLCVVLATKNVMRDNFAVCECLQGGCNCQGPSEQPWSNVWPPVSSCGSLDHKRPEGVLCQPFMPPRCLLLPMPQPAVSSHCLVTKVFKWFSRPWTAWVNSLLTMNDFKAFAIAIAETPASSHDPLFSATLCCVIVSSCWDGLRVKIIQWTEGRRRNAPSTHLLLVIEMGPACDHERSNKTPSNNNKVRHQNNWEAIERMPMTSSMRRSSPRPPSSSIIIIINFVAVVSVFLWMRLVLLPQSTS